MYERPFKHPLWAIAPTVITTVTQCRDYTYSVSKTLVSDTPTLLFKYIALYILKYAL